jgi:hypothetical protein
VLQELLNGDEIPAEISRKISQAESKQLLDWIKSLAGGANPRQLFA